MIGANRRSGLSLLEVILAFAILALALAVIGELVRTGARAASEARDLTRGQLLCESKVAEIAAGISPATAVQRAPFETDPEWVYSVEVVPTEQQGLLGLYVSVEPNLEDDSQRRTVFSLVRWIPDPGLGLSEDQAPPAEDAAASGTGSSSSSGSGSGGSGSGSGGNP